MGRTQRGENSAWGELSVGRTQRGENSMWGELGNQASHGPHLSLEIIVLGTQYGGGGGKQR